jgi:hypothetical protein
LVNETVKYIPVAQLVGPIVTNSRESHMGHNSVIIMLAELDRVEPEIRSGSKVKPDHRMGYSDQQSGY